MIIAFALTQGGWSEPARDGKLPILAVDKVSPEVIFLDGAVMVEKRPGFRVKTNSSELVPVKGQKDTYGSIGRVGGVNEGKAALKMATFIPLMGYREHSNPASQVLWIKVNGVEKPGWVFSGATNQQAIELLKKSFPGNRLLETQLDAGTPHLYIPLGSLAPGKKILVEYGLSPRSGIRVR